MTDEIDEIMADEAAEELASIQADEELARDE